MYVGLALISDCDADAVVAVVEKKEVLSRKGSSRK